MTHPIFSATMLFMLKIRLQRVGRVHEPVFRLVLTDSKNSTKSGRFKEVLGNFDARAGEKSVFDLDRVKYWLSFGAKPSPTVFNLLVDKKVILEKKINKLPKKTPSKKEGVSSDPVSQPEVSPEGAIELKDEETDKRPESQPSVD